MERRKLYIPRHKCQVYNYTYSLFLLIFPGSVAYLKLMKPKGPGELCAAISDLASQTGIKKNRSFDHPQAELDILTFQKTYKWAHIKFDQDWPTGLRDIPS